MYIENKSFIYRTMRTRNLVVSAIALPLFFTACTQDEFVSGENSSNPALANRKTVENVTINMSEPDTRMVFDGGYQWELNDQFGACLMDEYVDINDLGTWWEDFTLVDYIQTNYPFTRQENKKWTSEAVMQEGNYFFYYPYNYNFGGKRTPIRLTVPTEQYVEDGESASSVLDNQLFVGYAPILAEEGKESESLSLKMQPLLAFPAFNLKNVGTGSLTVYRIAFAADNKTWPTVYEIKPASGDFANSTFEGLDDDDQRAEIQKTVSSVSGKETSRVTVTFGEEGIELSSQEAMWAYIMLPPSANLNKPKLYIYTDAGLGIADLSEAHTDAGTNVGATNITNDRALTDFDYNDGAAVYITFDNTAMDQPFNMGVNNTTDLENLVYWSRNNTSASLEATVVGDQVEISKNVYDMLADNNNLILTVTCASAGSATVTIPADAPANALDRVKFENVNIVNKANVTLNGNVGGNQLTNEAFITLNGNNYSLSNAIVNNGTLTFQAADGGDMTVTLNYQQVITNNAAGTIVVATDVNVPSNGISNNGTLTINQGAELAARIHNGEAATDNGTLNVNGSWTSRWTSYNNGTVNVSATGSIAVENQTGGSKGFTNNKGNLIKNGGVVNGVINNGTIEMTSTNARLVTATSSTGEIDNTVGSNYVTKQEKEEVFCVVSEPINASDLNDLVRDANAKRLDISGTINVDGDDVSVEIETVEVVGNLNISGADRTLRFVGIKEMNITTGVTELAARSELALGKEGVIEGSLNVSAGARFIIANNAVLYATGGTISGVVENYGTWTKSVE